MKILLIGGTGVISYDTARYALNNEHEVYALNRGNNLTRLATKCHLIKADIRNSEDVCSKIGNQHFDVVVDFLSYMPNQLTQTFNNLKNNCKQYIFISSATAYSKERSCTSITEHCPVTNNIWDYAKNKSDCEIRLKNLCIDSAANYTIVRPYITYSDTRIPFGIIPHSSHWTLIARILAEKPIILWDEGKHICTLTHSSDFAKGLVGLFGNPAALNSDFHITSSECLSWKAVLETIATTIGKKAVVVNIPSEYLAENIPNWKGILLGDRATDMIFNNTKIKTAVPAFSCTTDFKTGIKQTIEYYQHKIEMRSIDYRWDALVDRTISSYYKENEPNRLKDYNLSYVSTANSKLSDRFAYMGSRYKFIATGISILKNAKQKCIHIMRSNHSE